MTKVLKLDLLGRPKIAIDDVPVTGLVSAKARALLFYLAVTGEFHSRQWLAGLLWPNMPEADARRNLRGVVMKLRQAVGEYLRLEHDVLGVDVAAAVWVDVRVFQEGVLGKNGRFPTPASLRTALDLYRGEFLEDFHVREAPAFEEWVTQQRTYLRELAIKACMQLISHCLQAGDYAAGITYARKLLTLDPAREEGHQQLMYLLALSGQRSAALAQYETCRRILQTELGIEPAMETAALYEQIRADTLRPPFSHQSSARIT
ncbi:MAG: SARP family transcriptional regulator, partial [Chloroflexi bacterium]